jgi:hypothetical protein
MNMGTMAAVVSACVATASLLAGIFAIWWRLREAAFRRGDVLAWANEVISTLEGLLLVFILKPAQLDATIAKEKVSKAIFDTAILTERGRIFPANSI